MNKVLIIGTGSIAKKHAINLHSLKYKIYIFSASKNKIILNNKKININYIYNLDNLKDFKFAVLANDTNKHLSILTILIKKKINVYCEKPITNKKFDYANIRKKIIQNKILIFTGYQLLQHEKIQYLKKIISKEKILSFNLEVGHDYKKWRKGTLKKNSYFLNQNKGGGVIFELIHEINLIQNLIGNIDYIKTFKKKSDKKYKFEDLAISILKVKNIIGSLHQDMISPQLYRRIKILTKNRLFILDIANNTLHINNKELMISDTDNSHMSLLKKNLIFFINLINKKKNTIKYFDQSVNDLKITLKMHSSI